MYRCVHSVFSACYFCHTILYTLISVPAIELIDRKLRVLHRKFEFRKNLHGVEFSHSDLREIRSDRFQSCTMRAMSTLISSSASLEPEHILYLMVKWADRSLYYCPKSQTRTLHFFPHSFAPRNLLYTISQKLKDIFESTLKVQHCFQLLPDIMGTKIRVGRHPFLFLSEISAMLSLWGHVRT